MMSAIVDAVLLSELPAALSDVIYQGMSNIL